jgi:NADPH:quinone reductase
MRAIGIQHFGGLDSLVIKNLPDPVAQPGSVLIEVKVFGINHAEAPDLVSNPAHETNSNLV